LVRVLSHDLANRITIIKASADLGLANNLSDKNFNRILVATAALTKIVKHVREMEAQKSGKMVYILKPIPLNSVIEQLKFTFADKFAAKHLNLSVLLDTDLSALADETVLTDTVLGNIISNAIKFTADGKSISVTAKQVGGDIRIEVKDQGIGIPKELQEIIFSPTAPTSRTGTAGEMGTGFGMPLVRAAVEQMGGTIKIDSNTGVDSPGHEPGTTITVTLKAA
jgi:signal transduction histidine kinase